ncbi:ATP-binding protein [Rummeliibacillus stabekisii]|uniref:ATP-binding protein n=1 Tax=Rummeliibacillus stabekisii TaxID=241244 RepID=UPI003723DBBE
MKNIIFIAGIHGVGKTTFSNELSEILQIKNFSASDLIRRKNQKLMFLDKSEENFILDGHFTLQNKNGTIDNIPNKTFRLLNPSLIILLSDQCGEILTRLNKRSSLARFSIENLEEMQSKEISQAYSIAKKLDIPIIRLSGFKEFKKYLSNKRSI